MFTFSNAMKNIRRHSRKSVLYFLICAVVTLTLQIYLAGIDRTETQLLALPDAMPISASVCSLDGSQFNGLQIRETTIEGLLSSAFVRDLKMGLMLAAGVRGILQEADELPSMWYVVAANSAEALEGFEPDAVEWLPGYGPDMLRGNEAVCVAGSHFMAACGFSLGDSIPLELYSYMYGDYGTISYEPLELVETRIVGAADLMTLSNAPHVILPFEYARAIFHRQGKDFNTSSASFDVIDTLRLNDFKAEMKTLRLNPVSYTGDMAMLVVAHKGMALLVNDAAFISAATRLRESLSLLRGFLPLMAVVLAAIGYFVAYLMIQSRREEYAVLRLLGMSRRESMRLYFTEMAALTLGGSLIGVLISIAAGIGSLVVGIWVFLLFSLCFMLGSFIALLRLGRTNVMLALAQPD